MSAESVDEWTVVPTETSETRQVEAMAAMPSPVLQAADAPLGRTDSDGDDFHDASSDVVAVVPKAKARSILPTASKAKAMATSRMVNSGSVERNSLPSSGVDARVATLHDNGPVTGSDSRAEIAKYSSLKSDGRDIRTYAVWNIRGDSAFRGIHVGEGNAVYRGIVAMAGGSIGGIVWKRFDTIADAIEKYHLSGPKGSRDYPTPHLWTW